MSSRSENIQLKKILRILKITQRICSVDFFIISHKFSNILRFFIISFIVIMMPFIVIYRLLNEPFRTREGIILRGAQFLSYTSRVPTFVVSLLACSYYRKRTKKLLEDVEALDGRFDMLGHNMEYGKLLQFSYFQISGIFCKICFQNLSYIGLTTGNHPLLDWLIFSIPIFLTFMLTLQWVILQKLQQMQIRPLRKFAKTMELNRIWLAADITKPNPPRHKTNEKRKEECFRNMANIFAILFRQNENVLKCFGLQIVCILVLIFISITYTSFKLVEIVSEKETLELRTIVYHILYCLIFVDIMMPCMGIQREVRIFAEYLSDLSVNYVGTSQDKEISSLLLQVQHQNIHCSILGFFDLNGSFLTGGDSQDRSQLSRMCSFVSLFTTFLVFLFIVFSLASARPYDSDETNGGIRYRRDHSHGITGPVHTYVKTDKHANFKWGVRHHVGHHYAGRK